MTGAELVGTYGFMGDLTDKASRALWSLQEKARAQKQDRPVERGPYKTAFCRPIDLPQPPMFGGSGCFLPEGFNPGDVMDGNLDTLSQLFGHLQTLCEELKTEIGP